MVESSDMLRCLYVMVYRYNKNVDMSILNGCRRIVGGRACRPLIGRIPVWWKLAVRQRARCLSGAPVARRIGHSVGRYARRRVRLDPRQRRDGQEWDEGSHAQHEGIRERGVDGQRLSQAQHQDPDER